MTTYALNETSRESSYKGVFGWYSYSGRNFADPDTLKTQSAIEIELFLKEHSIPTRKKKVTEIATMGSLTPDGVEAGTQMILEAAPELLTLTIGGWTNTPIDSNGRYQPKGTNGSAITDLAGYSYSEIISLYIEGHMNLTPFRALQRKDPDYFISPYGQKYDNPVISVWSSAPMAGFPKKHNLSATVLLEK